MNMFEQMFMWTGVVEDRNDPMKIGRVRVRILGVHSESIDQPDYASGEGLPVESLPWAQTIQSGNAATNGIGTDSLGLVEGSWVIGLSRDGMDCQDLVVLGSISGIPASVHNQNSGFGDHKNTTSVGSRPKRPNDSTEHYPKSSYLNEPDVNRLARNEKVSDTIVQDKKDNLDGPVTTGDGSVWSEPVTPYNASYPYNHVSESESGHIIERDDTPGSERTHDYHRSGTFEEVHPDGTKVTKVVKDNYEIIHGDDFVHIKGSCNITVDGNCNVKASDVNVKSTNCNVTASSTNITSDVSVNGSLKVNSKLVVLDGNSTTDGAASIASQ